MDNGILSSDAPQWAGESDEPAMLADGPIASNRPVDDTTTWVKIRKQELCKLLGIKALSTLRRQVASRTIRAREVKGNNRFYLVHRDDLPK